MSTLLVSDSVVLVPDWAGSLVFSGVPSGCEGWNAVRVPPRAQHDPSSEGSFALTCVQRVYTVSSDAGPRLCGDPVACSVVWGGGQVSWPQALRLLECDYPRVLSDWSWLPVFVRHLFMGRPGAGDMILVTFFKTS